MEWLTYYMEGALPVGARPEDVGPFGHQGVFGGALEITKTVIGGDAGWPACNYEKNATDPQTFGSDTSYRGYYRVRVNPPTQAPQKLLLHHFTVGVDF